jgi:alanine racemase
MKSWIEISGTSLRANYLLLKAAAGEGITALGVIKANGYGHDAVLCGRELVAAGATMLGVADVEEAARLRTEGGLTAPAILIMSGIETTDAIAVLQHRLTPIVWTAEQLSALEEAGAVAQQPVSIHLEVDTGMARQGALPGDELKAILTQLKASHWLVLEGLMTHLADSQVERGRFTQKQCERFEEALEQVLAAGLHPEYLHLANSSAIDEGSTLYWLQATCAAYGTRPMVRPGIALYGYILPIENQRDEQNETVPREGTVGGRLKPVLTWKTRIMALRELDAGQHVGYSSSFMARGPMRTALLPIGYSDGFRRSASSAAPPDWHRGWVMVGGKRAYILGRVSMNLTVIDVTDIPEAQVGTEVTLLGEGVTADDHAAWAGTISYEILCGIRARPVLV